MLAADCGKRDCLEALLQAGADKACAGSKGEKGLWEAASLSCRRLFPIVRSINAPASCKGAC